MLRAALVILMLLAGAVFTFALVRARAPDSNEHSAAAHIRVANWNGPGADPSYLRTEREVLEDFQRRHPDIRARIENIPGPGQYIPKLLMMYIAGDAPDVIHLDASSAAVLINNGLLADLAPFIEAEKSKASTRASDTQLQFDINNFFENVLDVGRRGQKLYAIPLDFTPMVLVYNRKLFREAGVPYPKAGWTREDFLQAARTLTVRQDGQTIQFAFDFQKDMYTWFPWIWAGGGDVLSPDGRRAIGYLDGPGSLATIQVIIDMITKEAVAPTPSQRAAAGTDLFRTGRAAMTVTGHWSLIEYRVDRLDIGIASIPRAEDGPRATVFYAAGMAISKSSRNKAAAWEYVKHMTSFDVQKKRVSTGVAISGNRKAAAAFAGNPVEDAFLEEAKFARPPWGSKCERYELVEDLGREMIEDILNSGIDVKQAARRTAVLIERQVNQP